MGKRKDSGLKCFREAPQQRGKDKDMFPQPGQRSRCSSFECGWATPACWGWSTKLGCRKFMYLLIHLLEKIKNKSMMFLRTLFFEVVCIHASTKNQTPHNTSQLLSVVLILLIPKLLLTYIVIVERNVAAPFRISYQTIIRIVLASCKWYRSLGRITRVPRRTRHLWFCLNLLEKIVLSVQPNRKNDKNRVTLLDRIGFLSSTGLAGYQAPSQHDVCHPNFQVPIRFTLSNFEFWWPLAIILVLPLPITWKPVWLQDAIRGIASVAVAQNFQNAKARVEAEKLTRFPFDRGKGQN